MSIPSTSLGEQLAIARARLRYPFSAFFGWFGTTVGILSGCAALVEYATRNTTTREWVLSMTLGLMTAASLVVLGYREYRLSRRSKFADILTHQEHASEILRDLRLFLRHHASVPSTQVPDDVLARARGMIGEVLSIYSDIFSILTSTRCRTCVKLIDVGATSPGEVHIFTLARDWLSSKENKNHDRVRAEQKLDKLNGNSDFLQLWDPHVDDEGYYLCNNLTREPNYTTSSLNYWRNVAGNPNKSAAVWPLWYRSTVVWPIRREPRPDLGISGPDCLGFVTVDSHLPNTFVREEHPPLGKMLANSLFPILDLYNTLSGVLASRQQETS